ncbi:hypothetical protein CA234_05810 [Sphingomonas sp. ABOLE]|uniref:hypothetical protein n=1 Tax=Sphingomonas sp. ABOLE TaxID=1985878 RepID=UPI000F7F615E|nr:hypothetical protein [Sphingomonas sp. ABOLE]RSV43216.1 hypothetical protein CA234_05810 [Sphingomonas sp. ABOLE]
MELLLLLTALFASLTGVSGERGLRPIQGVAVVRVAEAAQAAVAPSRHIVAAAAALPTLVRVVTIPVFHLAVAPRPALRLAFEQRRE